MLASQRTALAALVLAASAGVNALDLDVNSSDSILQASKTVVTDLLMYYSGDRDGSTPGLLPQPYYWWESGLMFDSLINYWGLSGDDSVVETIQDGILFQVGPDNNFMPPNQTRNEGNDDQSFWGLAAMTAAERDFPTRSGQNVSWLSLAQNVFDSQVPRWDESTCNGGLRWQIFVFNNGYNYKNSFANGNFMQLAARLYHYTGNSTYAAWAQRSYQWSTNVGLIEEEDGVLHVYDGTDSTTNCTQINHISWTANTGMYMNAFAFLGNSSGNASTGSINATAEVRTASQGLFSAVTTLFTANGDGILVESACEPINNCNTDQLAFRAVLARALGNLRDYGTAVPAADITTVLQNSARGAAASCSGGTDGTTCGSDWAKGSWDETWGVGEELCALEILLANLPQRPLVAAAAAAGAAANGTSTSPSTGASAGNSPAGTSSAATPTVSTQTGAASGLTAFSVSSIVLVLGSLAALL